MIYLLHKKEIVWAFYRLSLKLVLNHYYNNKSNSKTFPSIYNKYSMLGLKNVHYNDFQFEFDFYLGMFKMLLKKSYYVSVYKRQNDLYLKRKNTLDFSKK